MKTRQVAAHFVNFNGKILPMHVVVICNGKVTECFPLKEKKRYVHKNNSF